MKMNTFLKNKLKSTGSKELLTILNKTSNTILINTRTILSSDLKTVAFSTAAPSGMTIDLRSDTVTKPCPGMRAAMASAKVGDDVYGEDPTTKLLEEQGAGLLGMEAGLFVPSGTMANLLAVLCHCPGRGEEVLLGDTSHIHLWEQGGLAMLGGIHTRTIRNRQDGTFAVEDMKNMVQGNEDPHCSETRLVCIENTQNSTGGRVVPRAWLNSLTSTCSSLGLLLHCDGARLLHSSTALGIGPDRLLEGFNSSTLCLSKGLGAPIGSLVLGSEEMIWRARRLRKALGGGMRQTGVVAAAGLFGLEHVYPRLGEDHASALRLATCIEAAGEGKITIEGRLETNILIVKVSPSLCTAAELVELLKAAHHRVLALEWAPHLVRLVTHRDVDNISLEAAETSLHEVITNLCKQKSI